MKRGAGLMLVPIVLSGCGAQVATDRASSASPAAAQAAVSTHGGRVGAVRLTGDQRVLELTLDLPGDGGGCARSPRATLLGEESRAVYVATSFDLDRRQHCPASNPALRVTLSSRLAGRDLVIDQQPWVPAGAGTYRLCDVERDCQPAPAGCDENSSLHAIAAGDFPRSARGRVVTCQLPWLVMDVDIGIPSCGTTRTDSCPGQTPRVTRWLFTVRDATWTTVATLPLTGGCGADLRAAVPRALCRDLPAG
jgi:hypothetical protein